MVNDLLDIARIESGRVKMNLEPCDLAEIVGKVEDLLGEQIKEKGIEFKNEVKANEFRVLVDPGQIERVLINLIGNAMKFTPASGKITVWAQKKEKMVEVAVKDTGCGIPEEAQELIFEEFYRVEHPINQQVKGTGLGLSLVKYIVEAHGGKIWVKSKLNEGSTFIFTLPKG